MTSRGEAVLYNFLSANQFKILFDPRSEYVFKVEFLGNFLFALVQSGLERNIKLFIASLQSEDDLTWVQILPGQSLDLKNIIDIDVKNKNLLVLNHGIYTIYRLPECQIIYQTTISKPYYSKSHIIALEVQNEISYITTTECNTKQIQTFAVENLPSLMIYDHFSDYLVFSHQNSIKAYFFETKNFIERPGIPEKYYIGKENSIAIFPGEIVVMNKNMDVINVRVVDLCADLVGIVVAYSITHEILIFDCKGLLLQTIPQAFQLLSIGANQSTEQLFFASQDQIYIFD